MLIGVYCWRNRIDGKVYVGSASKSLEQRRRSHVYELNANRHRNRYLQNAWNKHGFEAFEFVVLELCMADQCLVREQHWMDHFQSARRKNGYNLHPQASSRRGAKLSVVQRARLSI